MKDRKKDFIENNLTLCEEDCDLIEYNSFTKKAKCSCKAKVNIPLISEISIDKKRLYNSFSDIKNIANLKVMKCYYILFDQNRIKNNYGAYITFLIIFLFFITIIIFYSKDNKEIYNIINDLINAKKNIYNKIIPISFQKKKTKRKAKRKRKKKIKRRSIKNKELIKENENQNNSNQINNSPPVRKVKLKKFRKKKYSVQYNKSKIIYNNLNYSNDNSNRAILGLSKTETINPDLYKDIMEFNSYELNTLNYYEALKIDKRNYFQYYLSLIKTKHLLIFSFYQDNDYNSKIIKIFLFFFAFTIYITINALFFNDETMHTIYKDGGSFNFIYQIPQIIYSSIISSVLNLLLRNLALSEKIILEIKHENETKNLEKKRMGIYKLLFCKFISFFIISFILIISFGYYLSCFCAVYKNTQIHLLKDTFISFGISMVYPLGIFLLPGIFRILSLKSKNKNNETMYKFSQILQLI